MPTIRNDDPRPGRACQALQFGTGLLALSALASGTEAQRHSNAASSTVQDAPQSLLPARTHHRHHGHGVATPATRVSLVIPNFSRPRNVEQIVQQVSNYHVVDETLIWDVHIDLQNEITIDAPQTWVIRTPEAQVRERWGLLARFKDCVLASNEWVLITDDDQLLGEQAIIEMMKVKQQDPDRLVCYFGREIGDAHTPEQMHYQMWDPPAPAQVPICLTKAVLTDRRFCLEALRQAPLVEDLAHEGVPYWNGEDIWHSLTSYHLTGKKHVLLPRNDATYTILPAPDGIGDARPGAFDHRAYREKMVQVGSQRLGLNVSMMHLQPWELNA